MPQRLRDQSCGPPLETAIVGDRRRTLPLTRDARLALLRRELTRLIDEGGDL